MRNLLSYLGVLMLIAGISLIIPIPAAIILGELNMIIPFALPAILALGIGYALTRIEKTELDLRTAFIVTALGWLVVTLFGSLPFIIALNASLLDAYFEAMCGFTTTGMSAFTPSELPRTLLFWRSLTEWIGGIGIILVLLVVLAPTNIASKFYAAEARSERLEPSIVNTAHAIFYIYAFLTLVGILLMYLAGLSVFDAVNHGMTAIATGGFSTHDDSMTQAPVAVKIVAMILMLAGAISFFIHQRWMSRDFKLLFTSLEVRTMALLIGVVTLLLFWDGVPFLDALFNVISGTTTTGFVLGDLSSYNDFSKYLLVLMMNIGGGYGSTSSGIKIIRFLILIKAVEWYIRKITSPPRVMIPFKIQNKVFTEKEVFTTLLYTVLHFFFLAGGIMIFLTLGNTLMDSLFMISSAQGNNGLVTLTQYTDPEKLVMIFHMWIGRLEIIPVLVLFTSIWRRT